MTAVSCSNAPLKLDLIVIEISNTIKYDFFTVLYCKEKVLETGGSPQEMLEQLWDVLEQVKYIVVFPVKGGPAQ